MRFVMLCASLFYFTTAMASDREVLKKSSQVDTSDIDEVQDTLVEQSILERLFLKNPGIIVSPYYDQTGRMGVKVVPNEGDPYYVDPYYDDPMTTNRHSDESNTSTNWRVFTWGDE